jgi:hypothetical protein
MATVNLGIESTGCGVCTLQQVSMQSPEETLRIFINNYGCGVRKIYVAAKGEYVSVPNSRHIHVIFGGPDMKTLRPGQGHYSAEGSCGAFAAFIRENSLGTVIETQPRHNPFHGERKEGEGDVIVYVWSPDAEALGEWSKKHLSKT